MTVWFTADHHFGHAKILEYTDRPFTDIDAMNNTLIANWNALVRDEDLVWVLGDFALGKRAETVPIVSRLRGRKILLAGNHDYCWSGHSKWEKWEAKYLAGGFAEVRQGVVTYNLQGETISMCHFPYHGDSHDDDRFTEYRPVDHGQVLLHGHVHEEWLKRDKMINVGVDVNLYAPISEKQVIAMIQAM